MSLPTGLADEEQPKFTAWQRALEERFAEINSVKLRVLIWGPGFGSPYGGRKRREVLDHLRNEFPDDEITTSEELIERAGTVLGNTVLTEMQHAETADLIIVLLSSSTHNTGALTELHGLARSERLTAKTRIYARNRDRDRGWDPGLVASAIRDFSLHYIHTFSQREWRECTNLRSQAEIHVQEMRRFRILEQSIA